MATNYDRAVYFMPYHVITPSCVTEQLSTSRIIVRLAEDNYERGRAEDTASLAHIAQRALIEAAETPFIDDENPDTITLDTLVTNTTHRTAIIAALISTRVRDMIIVTALEHPDTAGGVLRAIARQYARDTTVSANALALWALIGANEHEYDWAKAAASEALTRNRDHNLSRLIYYNEIEQAPMLALDGCNKTWEMINTQLR